MDHFVYILRCSDGTFYCGYTTDLERRVSEHNGEGSAGARYTRARRPVELMYHERHPDRSTAQRREAELKRLSRREKLTLLNPGSGATMA